MTYVKCVAKAITTTFKDKRNRFTKLHKQKLNDIKDVKQATTRITMMMTMTMLMMMMTMIVMIMM